MVFVKNITLDGNKKKTYNKFGKRMLHSNSGAPASNGLNSYENFVVKPK